MYEYLRFPEFWLLVCWVVLFVVLTVYTIVKDRRNEMSLFGLQLELMRRLPPPPPSSTGGEIFGYTGRITILVSPPIRTGTIPLKMKDGQKVVSRNLKMKSPIYRKIRKRTRTVRLKRIGRQAMRKQRIRIWILKPERSRSGGG